LATKTSFHANPRLGDTLVKVFISGVACFTITMFAGPYFIRMLRALNLGKSIKEELPQHLAKSGTPSMGGFLFTVPVVALTVATNLYSHLSMLLPVTVVTLSSALGWVDDRLTTLRTGGGGLRARFKFSWLVLIAVAIVVILHIPHLISVSDQNKMYVPAMGYVSIGLAYWPLAVLAIVGTANAVNLTDGLDGLAAGTGAMAFAAFGAIALLDTPSKPFLAQFSFTVVGAVLAFLWFNVFPARVIMGDTGALALGAALATVALLLNQMLILPVIGFVYVIETLSVIFQVGYYKLTHGKRIFRSAPLHNHLELMGWHENEVTQRFWIVSMLAAVAGVTLAFS
jgi:phospho-N-acetylmuramoyl-pentapeptide-transferase